MASDARHRPRSARRCYDFGIALRKAIETMPGGKRVLLIAAGPSPAGIRSLIHVIRYGRTRRVLASTLEIDCKGNRLQMAKRRV